MLLQCLRLLWQQRMTSFLDFKFNSLLIFSPGVLFSSKLLFTRVTTKCQSSFAFVSIKIWKNSSRHLMLRDKFCDPFGHPASLLILNHHSFEGLWEFLKKTPLKLGGNRKISPVFHEVQNANFTQCVNGEKNYIFTSLIFKIY
jgi:hypothetical protein